MSFAIHKTRATSFHLSRTLIDATGTLLTLLGFILVLLTVIGNSAGHLKSLYFLKLTQVSPTPAVIITLGMFNYCLYQADTMDCIQDDGIMIVPYDVNLTNKFNATFPQLFLNGTPPDPDLDPYARPDPPHDSHIYVASILCLLSSGCAIILCVMKFNYRRHHLQEDTYFSRGFLAAMAASISLLLVALASTMYPVAATQLNMTYPNIQVTLGPCVAMQGAAFMVFSLASMCLLRGCGKQIESFEKLESEYR